MPTSPDLFDAVLALPLPAAVIATCDRLCERAQTTAETLLAQADALLAGLQTALVSLSALAGC